MSFKKHSLKAATVIGALAIGSAIGIFMSKSSSTDGPYGSTETVLLNSNAPFSGQSDCSQNEYFESHTGNCVPMPAATGTKYSAGSYMDEATRVPVVSSKNIVEIRQIIRDMLPGVTLDSDDIVYLENVSMYAFVINNIPLYITSDGKGIVSKEGVIDVELAKTNPEMANMTVMFSKLSQGKISSGKTNFDFKNLDYSKVMTLTGAGNHDLPTQKFLVLFDITCPYCKRIFPKLQTLADELPIEINLLLFSRYNTSSTVERTEELFCSFDADKNLSYYLATRMLPNNMKKTSRCNYDPDYPYKLLKDDFTARTPTIFSSSGKVIHGDMPIEELRALMMEGQ